MKAELISDSGEQNLFYSEEPGDLSQLNGHEGFNGAILVREPLNFQDAIDEVTSKSGGKWTFAFQRSHDINLVGAVLDEEFELQSKGAFDFYSDVMHVAEMFFEVTKAKMIGVQLELVENDLCRNFHVDKVFYRLITTYRGPTTQWLSNSNVNREELGGPANHKVPKDNSLIQNFPEFALGIFKGEKLAPGGSLVHRSPPLFNAREKRLIMRMDALEI